MCFNPRRIPKHLILEQPRRMSFLERHWVKLVGYTTFLLLGLALSDLVHAQSSQYLETTAAGNLYFVGSNGYQPATHVESHAEVNINGMVARLILTQHFRNDSEHWQEATYVFPLSETSAVNRMEMHIGGRHIVARIRERQEAKALYQQAVSAGKKAALTEQQRPNLFTQKIANIAPGESVAIELHITQPIDYQQGQFSWRLPMTLTPRYIPNRLHTSTPANALDAAINNEATSNVEKTYSVDFNSLTINSNGWGWGLATPAVPDAPVITPFYHRPTHSADTLLNPIRLSIQLAAGLPLAKVSSSYHDIQLYKDGAIHHISTQSKYIAMDRDFELTWRPVAGTQPEAALFTETINNEEYALLMLLPPSLSKAGPSLPRDITFIIDTSGSMAGPSINQAKESLQLAVTQLKTTDRFNIIEFNSTHSALFSNFIVADEANKARATRFIDRLEAGGGTEMYPALQSALHQEQAEDRLAQVVFITDGSVGNENELLQLIHKDLNNARLFTVAIGTAPNNFFMRKAAQFGRGTFTHIGDSREVAKKMHALFEQLNNTVLSNLNIQWPSDLQAEIWPQRLPDLYQNEPLLLAVKFNGKSASHAQIKLSGITSNSRWQRELTLPQSPQPALSLGQQGQPKGIATLWARAKIEALLDEGIKGRSASSVRSEVLHIALAHELISPYTSLLAIDESADSHRPSNQTLHSTPAPNLLPHGQTGTPLSYPKTATPAPLQRLLALLFLSLFFVSTLTAYLLRKNSSEQAL